MSHGNEGRQKLSNVYWRRTGWQDRCGPAGNKNLKAVLVGACNESTKLEKDFDAQDEASKYLVDLVRDASVERMDVGYECWFDADIALVRILTEVAEIRHLHLLYENTMLPDDDKQDHYCDSLAPLFWNVPKLTAQCLHGDDTPGAPASQCCRAEVRVFNKDENGVKTFDIAGMFCERHSLRKVAGPAANACSRA